MIPENIESLELGEIRAIQKAIALQSQWIQDRFSTIEEKLDMLLTQKNKQYIEVRWGTEID